MASIRPPRADRILIVRLGALGDVVRTLPAVHALRSVVPGAHLAWLVEPDAAGAVDASPLVDETIVFPRPRLARALRAGDGLSLWREGAAFLRRLRARRFELALDFHGILKSGLLAWLSGAPTRMGHARGASREGAFLFANERVVLASSRVSRFERNAALVRALAPHLPPVLGPIPFGPSRLAEARVASRLRERSTDRGRDVVLIHPGSSRGAHHKRYAPDAWGRVAGMLEAEGLEVWIASGSSRHERALQERVVGAAAGAVHPAPETRSFDDLLALLREVAVFASADTGPLHAASLMGVPVVQVLGPTDPVHNRPWAGTPWRRVHAPLPCSPCRRGCADPACMRTLPPALVAREILSLHSGRAGRRASSSEAPR